MNHSRVTVVLCLFLLQIALQLVFAGAASASAQCLSDLDEKVSELKRMELKQMASFWRRVVASSLECSEQAGQRLTVDLLIRALSDSSLNAKPDAAIMLNLLSGASTPHRTLNLELGVALELDHALRAVPRLSAVRFAIPALVEAVADRSNDWNTRRNASMALGKLGAIEARRTLEELLFEEKDPALLRGFKISLLAIYEREKIPAEERKKFTLP